MIDKSTLKKIRKLEINRLRKLHSKYRKNFWVALLVVILSLSAIIINFENKLLAIIIILAINAPAMCFALMNAFNLYETADNLKWIRINIPKLNMTWEEHAVWLKENYRIRQKQRENIFALWHQFCEIKPHELKAYQDHLRWLLNTKGKELLDIEEDMRQINKTPN